MTLSTATIRQLDAIVEILEFQETFWTKAHGWAPASAAALLSRSQLQWQTSLGRSLRQSADTVARTAEPGALILAWANLGALVEGTLKLFLAVWYDSYSKDVDRIIKRGVLRDPDILFLEELRQFFQKKGLLTSKRLTFVSLVQQRRNAIHAFKARPLGTPADFISAVGSYREFVEHINSRLPYPA